MFDRVFWLVDRRTIVAVTATLLVAHYFLGYSVPIDTSSPMNVVTDIAWLIGYFFLARSGFRLACLPLLLLAAVVAKCVESQLCKGDYGSWRWKLREPWVNFWVHLGLTGGYDKKLPESSLGWAWDCLRGDWTGFWGVLDRAIVVGLALASASPWTNYLVATWGPYGLAILLLVYVAFGSFSFLVKDAVKRAEEGSEDIPSVRVVGMPSVYVSNMR